MALASCSDDTLATYTVGEENNVLSLLAGVDNRLTANTRATDPSYVALTQGTAARLRVEGTWKKSSDDSDVKEIIKLSTATAAEPTDAINDLTLNPQLYWDDYGTADPNNTVNRNKGLNIYGVAVDGLTNEPEVAYTTTTSAEGTTASKDEWGSPSSATTESNTITWSTVEPSNSDQILHRDLLVSNNLSDETTSPGRYTFEEKKTGTADQNKLVFKHVLSKITFNLKAADGFENYKFKATPTVVLTSSKNSAETASYYCYTNGTINIKSAKATATGQPTSVTLKKTNDTYNTYQVVTEEAVVYPGSTICSSDNDIVAAINADGNIYYVYAQQMMAAIDKARDGYTGEDKYQTQAGYNYVFNVTLMKTAVIVTATITDWQVVNSETAYPKVDVVASVGTTDAAATFTDGFSFYRMANESEDKIYNEKNSDGYYPEEVKGSLGTTISGSSNAKQVTFSKDGNTVSLYWPDHQTHYHFRGVYPQTGTSSSDKDTKPLVENVTKSDNSTVQGIHVKNQKYDASSMEAKLMISAPEIEEGTLCGNLDHTQVDMSIRGICAREGTIDENGNANGGVINLNFRYMMSQVVVNLSTTDGSDKVNLSSKTKVELEGAETQGYVGLHSRAMDSYDTGATKGYTMNNTTTEKTCTSRHDLIVPQALKNLKFKISILDDNNNVTDIYRASIADVQVYAADADGKQVSGAKAEKISNWESGKKYIYNLKLSKTKVNVTATLTDWTTKTADTEIWF